MALVLVATAAAPRTGGAQESRRKAAAQAAEDTDRKAKTLFAAGRYEEAIELLAQLYADTANPIYLRNIGRCYQRLHQPDKAIGSFEEYLLRGKDITPAERDEVKGFIRDLEEMKRRQAKQAEPAPPPPVVAAPPVPAAAVPQPAPAASPVNPPVPSPSPPAPEATPPVWSAAPPPPGPAPPLTPPAPAGDATVTASDAQASGSVGAGRLISYVLGAAGVVAVAAGGVALASSWGAYNDAKDKGCGTALYCSSEAGKVNTRNTLAKVLFVGGAALGVAGVTVFLLSPAGDDRGMALGWRGRF